MDGDFINMQRQATRLGAAPGDQASRQTMLTGLGMADRGDAELAARFDQTNSEDNDLDLEFQKQGLPNYHHGSEISDFKSSKTSQFESSSAKDHNTNDKSETHVCRICLGTEEEGTPGEDGTADTLICPCKCAGSMGMIHTSCLKEWVNSKRLVYKGKKV